MGKHLRKIRCKRKYFVKYFVVSLILMILACLTLMCCKQGIYNMVAHFYNLSYKEFDFHVLGFMSFWKLLIIQFALAPAIAMFWAEKSHEKNDDLDDEYENRRL